VLQGPLQMANPPAAELWGPGGELLAVTHQIVYYKA
jgi:hypothetical protein